MHERIVDLENEAEAQVFGSMLAEEGIPFFVRSNHDTAYDGVYQLELGWGYLVAPVEYRDRIKSLYEAFRTDRAFVPDRETNKEQAMKLIFLGPPGAGKGTLAAIAKDRYGLPHVSTGDIFREAIKNETELGKKVKGILASGELVPDELTVALVKDRLAAPDASKGFILDGFPRTIPQAEALELFAPVEAAVDFRISDELVVERLSGRRVCKSCGRNYNVKFVPPKKEGICDACGGQLYVRDDDKIEAINNRLSVYRAQTAPLIEYYRKRGKLLEVDASVPTEKVIEELDRKLKP
jgi:adenylate kinase